MVLLLLVVCLCEQLEKRALPTVDSINSGGAPRRKKCVLVLLVGVLASTA